MMEEDYVSFETAKLLKEKGFSLPSTNFEDWVFCMYDENGDIKWGCYHSKWYARVTLQMAMKWLREVHKLYIEITPSSKTNEFIVDSYRIDIVTRFFDTIYVSSGYNTYEQACETAIKYCLENLI